MIEAIGNTLWRLYQIDHSHVYVAGMWLTTRGAQAVKEESDATC